MISTSSFLIYVDSAQAYHIKLWQTKSRSLLVITANLVLILLSLDVLLLAMLPQYATFSSQHYVACSENTSTPYPLLPTPLPDSPPSLANKELMLSTSSSLNSECQQTRLLPCDWNAPKGECIMTRISVLWMRVSYKTWYFAALYYFITWIFLAVVVLEGCIATLRRSHTTTSETNRPSSV